MTFSTDFSGRSLLVGFSALFAAACCAPAAAQVPAANPYGELETKYLFGFTSGADIGAEGEKEVSVETSGRFGKRVGTYAALEHRLEFETTLSQFVQIELGLVGSTHNIRNVPGIDDIGKSNLQGAFAEIRYLLIEKTPNSRFGLTLSFEPNWARIDDSTGEHVTKFEFETKLQADYEFVPNTVYGALNLIYEPEFVRDIGKRGWERETTLGVSAALAGRIASNVVLGAELGYFRKYDQGLLFNRFKGEALFAGPTLYVQLTRKSFLSAAFSTQIAGRSTDNPTLHLDLDNFARYRAKLKFGLEF